EASPHSNESSSACTRRASSRSGREPHHLAPAPLDQEAPDLPEELSCLARVAGRQEHAEHPGIIEPEIHPFSGRVVLDHQESTKVRPHLGELLAAGEIDPPPLPTPLV